MKKTARFLKFLLVVVLFTILPAVAFADTYVSGTISSDRTWTCANSPYIATDNVLVMNGVTLTIEPCVTVKFNSGKAMQIDGTLIARGTSSNKITFTSSQVTPVPGNWGYIFFSDSSTDAIYDENGNYAGGSIIEYVVVEYAGGVSVNNNGAVRMDNAHPFINYCIIRNNKASGIFAWNLTGNLKITNSTLTENNGGISTSGGIVTISNNTISNNNGDGITVSGTITIKNNIINNNSGNGISNYSTADITTNTIAYNTGSGIHTANFSAVSISNNTISNNTGGGVSTLYSSTSTISNNIISSNTASRGGGITVIGQTSMSTITISDNIIINNIAFSEDGGGIVTNDASANISNNIISNNTASGNGGGISGSGTISNNIIANNIAYGSGGGICSGGSIINNSIVRNSAQNAAAVCYNDNFSSNTIMGNIATGVAPTYTIYVSGNSLFNSNNIFGNTAIYDLWNDNAQGSPNLNTENNWWGTAIESKIQAKIYDWFDDSSKGIVDYSPFNTVIRTDAPISPPTNLTATAGIGQITLTWSANPESDVTGYKVYWDTDPGHSYANSVDVGNVTNYIITDLDPAKTYYVTVTAYDANYNPANDDPNTIVNENQTNGNESWYANAYPDADGDDYTSDRDCNDNNPNIHPGAIEICNGVDDNCNGLIDEVFSLNTYYQDFDNDTYGNPLVSQQSCTQPSGYVTDNTDCNDSDAAISPSATEVCDGVDNNCDGAVDEGCGPRYMCDINGDGFCDISDVILILRMALGLDPLKQCP